MYGILLFFAQTIWQQSPWASRDQLEVGDLVGRIPVEADKACSVNQTTGTERDHFKVWMRTRKSFKKIYKLGWFWRAKNFDCFVNDKFVEKFKEHSLATLGLLLAFIIVNQK